MSPQKAFDCLERYTQIVVPIKRHFILLGVSVFPVGQVMTHYTTPKDYLVRSPKTDIMEAPSHSVLAVSVFLPHGLAFALRCKTGHGTFVDCHMHRGCISTKFSLPGMYHESLAFTSLL
jgi:hypothetical protein